LTKTFLIIVLVGDELQLDIPVSSVTRAGRYEFFKVIGYEPHPGQRKIHDSESRFRVVSAASRFGKSHCTAMEVCTYAHLHNKMIWIAAPTYELSEKVFRLVWRTMIEERKYETIFKSYRDRKIKFAWGTEIHGKSCQNPESLLGEGVDFLVIDEASRIRKDHWNEYLRMRLIDKSGYALIISSPKGSSGWFPNLYRRGQDELYEQWWSVSCALAENPRIPREEIELLKATLPKESYDQEVMGKFVPYGGLVYKEWDAERLVTKALDFIPSVPIILAVDFGTRNPCAALFCQKIGEKLFNVFDEYYVKGRITIDHAIAVRTKLYEYMAKSKHQTVDMYHDPSGLDQSLTFKKIIPELVTIPAVNDIVPGVNTVSSFIKPVESGRPKVLIHDRCQNLVWELGLYHYPKTTTIGRADSEIPVDVDNHAIDALRYMLHTMCPVSSLPLNISALDAKFSKPIMCIQEAGNDYVREIDNLKSAFQAETEETPGKRR
jgi:hypothetical protein